MRIGKQQLTREWEKDQLDPDNWFVIPEFNVKPADVGFVGFGLPIVHPNVNGDERQVRLIIRDLVTLARDLARKDFSSLCELRANFIEVLDKFDWDLDDTDNQKAQQYTDLNATAFGYDCVMRDLRNSVEKNSTKNEALLDIALAAQSLCNWIAGGNRISIDRMKLAATERARKAANALHNKPDGTRAKVKKIRELWASGKFKSRDICAEQECAALEMSWSAARKALRNTPKPT